jgi:RNA polymerase sigma factor (sigma-70 family)
MVEVHHTAVDVRGEFDRTFTDLVPRLYRRALALTGCPHTAEDALHDTYLKLVARPERLVSHPLPYAYAYAGVVSVVRDGWRRRQREVLHPELADLTVSSSDDGPARWEADQETARLLAHLTAKQAAVVLLVDVDGYTIDQAAEVLGLHRGTVSRSRRRALDKLRSLLDGTPFGNGTSAEPTNEHDGGRR